MPCPQPGDRNDAFVRRECCCCFFFRHDLEIGNVCGNRLEEIGELSLGAERRQRHSFSDDGFGDITTVHGNVLATTCSVPQTLAANGGQYNCTFDAHFCGGSHTNTVSATLSDDEGNTVSPTGSATVTVTAQ